VIWDLSGASNLEFRILYSAMFNPLNFFKKIPKQPENFIALDFGTTSTKAFIFSLPAGRQASNEQVQLLGKGKGTPSEAVEQAADEAGLRPQQAVVALGGQNCWSLTTTIRLNRPHPEKEIRPDEIQKLNEQIFKTAQIKAAVQMPQFTGDLELIPQLIDSETLYYKLDGRVYSPGRSATGEGGQVLEASISTAYSPTAHLQQLSKTLKELNLDLWAVSSLMFILVKALANGRPKDFNALILDIGGEITDLAVVFGGGVWGSVPLPIGGETFTDALIKRLAFDKKEAKEEKIAYAKRQIREERSLKIEKALESVKDLWLSGVETALQNFEGIKTFPPRIILTGNGARLEQLKEHLSDYPLMKTLPFTSPPTVEVRTDIGPQDMRLVGEEIWRESNES